MTQPPEAVQPVERQRRMDAERQFLAAFVGPLQIRVFDVRCEVAAGKVTVAVRLEPEARGEFLVVRVVVRENRSAGTTDRAVLRLESDR